MTEDAATLTLPTLAEGIMPPPPELGVPVEPPAEPPAEGQGEGEEGQKPPIASWEQLEQTEWFPAALEERKAAFIEEAKPEILKEAKRQAYREFDPHMQSRGANLNKLLEMGQKAVRTLERVVEDGTWDRRAAEDWAADNKELVNGLSGAYWSSGVESTLNSLAQAAGDSHLISDMHIRLVNILQGQPDAAFVTDFLDRLTEAKTKEAVKAAEEKGRQLGLKENRSAQAEQQAAQQRKTEGAVLAPGSPAGVGGGFRTKTEARTLHVQGKISHAEMRRINADPSIPEM